MTEYDNISSGPVADDDDALPSTDSLQQAVSRLLGGPEQAPTSTPSPAANAAPGASEPAPLRLKPNVTPAQIQAYIETLQSKPAWADKNHPEHAEVHRHLRASYQALEATPEAPAPTPHPQQQRAQATGTKAMAEARIRQIEGSKEWARGDAKVLAELKTLYQQLNPSAVPDELPHVGELRRVTGTEGPRALPSHYAENWNTDVESEYLAIGSKAGIKGEVLQAALNWYVSMGVLGGAFERGFTKEHEAEFIEAAPSMGLNDAQAQGIVQWFRSVEKDTR